MKPIRDGQLNCDKLAELLCGPDDALTCVKPYYSGYDGDREAMRQDWEAWGDRIKSFWASGEYTTTETVAAHGIDVKCFPWVFVRGCCRPCWAEREFDLKKEQQKGDGT